MSLHLSLSGGVVGLEAVTTVSPEEGVGEEGTTNTNTMVEGTEVAMTGGTERVGLI